MAGIVFCMKLLYSITFCRLKRCKIWYFSSGNRCCRWGDSSGSIDVRMARNYISLRIIESRISRRLIRLVSVVWYLSLLVHSNWRWRPWQRTRREPIRKWWSRNPIDLWWILSKFTSASRPGRLGIVRPPISFHIAVETPLLLFIHRRGVINSIFLRSRPITIGYRERWMC